MHIITKKSLFPLLEQLLSVTPLIIEAGAFDGRDTRRIASHFPQAIIHAFEPVKSIFAALKKGTASYHNIKCYPYALSNTVGQSIFHLASNPSKPNALCQAGSLLKPKERLNWSSISYDKTELVSTITLDVWAEQHDINWIDLLWLDTQGCTLPILKAAQRILPSIKLLYLEVEFIEAYRNQSQYADVKQWLNGKGFKEIGRDFTNTADWFFGNVLFQNENLENKT